MVTSASIAQSRGAAHAARLVSATPRGKREGSRLGVSLGLALALHLGLMSLGGMSQADASHLAPTSAEVEVDLEAQSGSTHTGSE